MEFITFNPHLCLFCDVFHTIENDSENQVTVMRKRFLFVDAEEKAAYLYRVKH